MGTFLVSLIVFVLVIGLCFYVVNTAGPALKIPPAILTVLNVLLVVFVVLWLIGTLLPHTIPIRVPWPRS